jgi:molecular chaperone GrpE
MMDGLREEGGERAPDPGNIGAEASPELIEEQEVEAGLERESSQLERELESMNDRHLRLAAEFDNYRRRVQSEMAESWVRAQADLVRRLLDPLEDLQRVALLEPETATVQAIVEGVDMVERKFLKALAEAGVEVLSPVGEAFDPAVMEAVMRVPAETSEEDDRVHQVFERGFVLKGHLVRPARVAVRKFD